MTGFEMQSPFYLAQRPRCFFVSSGVVAIEARWSSLTLFCAPLAEIGDFVAYHGGRCWGVEALASTDVLRPVLPPKLGGIGDFVRRSNVSL